MAESEHDPSFLGAAEAAAAIHSGRLTSTGLVNMLLDRVAAAAALNAFISLDADRARAAAAAVDRGAADGLLAGVPLVVKDNINVAGLATTVGTPVLRDFRPAFDAPIVQRLRRAGAIVLGKTNMHELALGVTSNNAAFGPVRNARDPDRFAGGSSGGTAAAVAAHLACAGLGSDTGGSVREPAALNGVVGFRPTVGRYPSAGIAPISHTIDTPGLIARGVEDVMLLDGIITGDHAAAPVPLAGLRLGMPQQFHTHLDRDTARVTETALKRLETVGATLVPVDIAEVIELKTRVNFPVALWEMPRDFAAWLEASGADTSMEDVLASVASPDVRRLIDTLVLGDQAISTAQYAKAIAVDRPRLQLACHRLFADTRVDALVFPTTPLPAQPIAGSDDTVMLNGKAVPTQPTFSRHTDLAGAAGLPGLSLPSGFTDDGLPVGLELDGPALSDRRLLAIGLAVERVLGVS